MASYLFKNNKTGEFKVVNSKDSTIAKRSYSNKTWEYIKAVPQQKPTHVKISQKEIVELQLLSRALASQVMSLRDNAREYDVRFAMLSASAMEDLLSKIQQKLKVH